MIFNYFLNNYIYQNYRFRENFGLLSNCNLSYMSILSYVAFNSYSNNFLLLMTKKKNIFFLKKLKFFFLIASTWLNKQFYSKLKLNFLYVLFTILLANQNSLIINKVNSIFILQKNISTFYNYKQKVFKIILFDKYQKLALLYFFLIIKNTLSIFNSFLFFFKYFLFTKQNLELSLFICIHRRFIKELRFFYIAY